jgi:hypothetical protein
MSYMEGVWKILIKSEYFGMSEIIPEGQIVLEGQTLGMGTIVLGPHGPHPPPVIGGVHP